MSRAFLSAFVLLFFITSSQSRPLVSLLTETSSSTEFVISFEEPAVSYIGNGFSRFYMNEFGPRGNELAPMLIGRIFNVAVPKQAQVNVSLVGAEWTDWLDLLPAPMCSLTLYHNIPGQYDEKYYQSRHGGSVELAYDHIWRGVRVLGIDVIPIEYDPANGVRFMKSARIRVDHPNGVLPVYDDRLYTYDWGAIYRACLVNPESAIPPSPKSSFEWNPADGAKLLIITRPEFDTVIQRWANWKLLIMPTKIVTTNVTGTTTTSIKNYIQNAYDTWAIPPEYVLLVSDGESGDPIPIWNVYGGCIGDNDYGTTSGSDIFPDVHPGRMSADYVSQIQVVVQKHFNFEKEPDMSDNWWARAVGVCNEDDCTDPLGPVDSSYLYAVQYAMNKCQAAGYTSYPVFRDCLGHTATTVSPYIQAGCGFVTYRGQAWPDWYPPFNGLNSLNTGRKCPVNVSITCGTGSVTIFGDNNYCEVTTRAGTVASPKGSVACYGQTQASSNSLPRSTLSREIFEGFFEAGLNALGAVHTYAKIQMYNEFGGSNAARVEVLTSGLVGSPEMYAWTGPIRTPVVTHPASVSEGPQNINVTVYVSGAPFPNARVSISQSGTYSYGTTNASGSVTISKNVTTSAPLIIAVTGRDIYPYIDTIDVVVSGVAIYTAPTTYNDIVGNHDGLINPGERISFRPRITNVGTLAASGLTGKLRVNDPLVSLIDSTCTFPTVGPGDTVYGDTVAFLVSSGHTATENLNLTLYVSGHPDGPWTRTVLPDAAVHRFDATLGTITINDPPPFGDGDGKIEPSEQVDLTIQILNNTQADISSLSGVLGDWSYVVSVQDYGSYGTILRGSNRTNTPVFSISVSPNAPPATNFSLNLYLTGNGGTYTYNDTIEVPLHIYGDSTALPTGPDSYGYYIVDNTDVSSGLAPTYVWNSIRSSGSLITGITNRDDRDTTISTPFAWKFYGNRYTGVSVSSNGWIAPPGVSWGGSNSGTPQRFPNVGGPAGVIAPYWADLAPHRTNGGEIYSYYDATNHQFVIQWDSCQIYSTYEPITVQIRICDTTYYPTPTRDSEFYIYYNLVQSYSNFGVGIESPDETRGVQYYHQGNYDIHAAPIQNGRALRITTQAPTPPSFVWLYYLDSLLFDDVGGNNIIEPGDQIQMFFRLKNGGTANAVSTQAQAVTATYITPTGSPALFGTISSGAAKYNTGSPVRFNLSPSCPSDTFIKVPVSVTANSGGYADTIAFWMRVGSIVGIPTDDGIPVGVTGIRTYPNPFNNNVEIEIVIGNDIKNREIDISIYSLDGRKQANIYNGRANFGQRRFSFDANGLPSGIYFVKLVSGEVETKRKILLLK